MISCADEECNPLVISGNVYYDEGYYFVPHQPGTDQLVQGEPRLVSTNFEIENITLRRRFEGINEGSGLLSQLPVLKDSGMVAWTDVDKFWRSPDRRIMVEGLIAGLTLLSVSATCEILSMLQAGATQKENVQNAGPSSFSTSQFPTDGLYWIWWSCPKPSSLKEWVAAQLSEKEVLSIPELKFIYEEQHPILSGFYRIQISEGFQALADCTDSFPVDILWMTNGK